MSLINYIIIILFSDLLAVNYQLHTWISFLMFNVFLKLDSMDPWKLNDNYLLSGTTDRTMWSS